MEGCTAFGKVYHKECFKCCVCKKRIDGKFFEKNGKPYCEKDWAVSIIIIQYWFHEFFFYKLYYYFIYNFCRKWLKNVVFVNNQSKEIALNPEKNSIILYVWGALYAAMLFAGNISLSKVNLFVNGITRYASSLIIINIIIVSLLDNAPNYLVGCVIQNRMIIKILFLSISASSRKMSWMWWTNYWNLLHFEWEKLLWRALSCKMR